MLPAKPETDCSFFIQPGNDIVQTEALPGVTRHVSARARNHAE